MHSTEHWIMHVHGRGGFINWVRFGDFPLFCWHFLSYGKSKRRVLIYSRCGTPCKSRYVTIFCVSAQTDGTADFQDRSGRHREKKKQNKPKTNNLCWKRAMLNVTEQRFSCKFGELTCKTWPLWSAGACWNPNKICNIIPRHLIASSFPSKASIHLWRTEVSAVLSGVLQLLFSLAQQLEVHPLTPMSGYCLLSL